MLAKLCQYTYINTTIELYISIIRGSNGRDWNESFTAARLTELWVAYTTLLPSRAQVSSLRLLRDMMVTVTVAVDKWRADEDKNESKAMRSSLNYQKYGERVQDTVRFDPEERDTLPCPECGHLYGMPVEAAEVINGKNAALLAGYADKIRKWSDLPKSPRGGKSRKAGTSSQLLGCYCFNMNSMLKSSGGNCMNCQDAVAVGGSNLEQDKNGGWSSTCEVCACDCQVTYQRGDRFKIALNKEKAKQKGSIAETPPEDSVSFFHLVISSTLVDSTLDAGKEVVSKEEQSENLLALATTNLLCNPHVQNNVALRNNLQKKIVDRPRVARGGKTINQVRMQYFNTASNSSSSSTINTINKRFYNNKLLRNESSSPSTQPINKYSSSSTQPIDLSEIATPPLDKVPPPTPNIVSTSTPVLIKKTQVRINKRLWSEKDTLGEEEKESSRKVQCRLSTKDEELCTALLDTESEFKKSIEAVDYCTNYVG